MRFSGRILRDGRYWVIEVPILGVCTQGFSEKDAYFMIADAIEELVYKDGFKITVHPGEGGHFEIEATDTAALIAFMLKQERLRSGLSLQQVAERLGVKSHNAYARYEQGRSVPTIEKLAELYAAVSPGSDMVLGESRIEWSDVTLAERSRY